jgi:putative hydrolase of the HAD superfamily
MDKSIKAVIFDGEGMVITSEKFYLNLVRSFGTRAEVINPFYANEYQLCLLGKADMRKELKPYLKQLGGQQFIDDFLKNWFASEDQVDSRIIDTIYELKTKGVKCYLATNQEEYHAEYMLETMGFKAIFDKVFFSYQIGYLKPQNEFYEFITSELGKEGLTKDQLLFWDDRHNNVETCRNLGLKAEFYKNFNSFQDTLNAHGLL